MGRILLIVVGSLLGLCLICLGLAYFVVLPRFQDAVEDDVQEAVATYVAPHIAGRDVTPVPGIYVLSAAAVNEEIQAGSPSLEDLEVVFTPEYVELSFGDAGQDVTYRAGVRAVNGRLELTDADIEDIPGWALSADRVSDGIESGINEYLAQNGLVLTSVTLGEGELTLETSAAG